MHRISRLESDKESLYVDLTARAYLRTSNSNNKKIIVQLYTSSKILIKTPIQVAPLRPTKFDFVRNWTIEWRHLSLCAKKVEQITKRMIVNGIQKQTKKSFVVFHEKKNYLQVNIIEIRGYFTKPNEFQSWI